MSKSLKMESVRSLRWTEENAVHVPEIDAEHQAMFRLAADLRGALMDGAKQSQVELLARRLSTEVTGHLAHEERLLRASRYPALEWHERQHQSGRARVAALQRAIAAGDLEAVFDALESLAGWLRDHTSVADRMAGAYLRNQRRSRASTVA